jgi:flagellar L-ring protein precursor FlgH
MNQTLRTFARIATAAAATLLAACQTPVDRVPWEQPVPVAEMPRPQGNGAIYQPGRDGTLFENPTAHRVGDLLTIRLEENTSASKSAKTSTAKSTSVAIPGPTVLGRPVTVGGVPILETEISGDHSFDGKGDSSQSNKLYGNITVTVVGRVGNGNLLVRGQKWLALNQGSEFVRVEGVVRPMDVEPNNSVPSWKVADARISYGGKGAVPDANAMGWLARIFNSPVMPF